MHHASDSSPGSRRFVKVLHWLNLGDCAAARRELNEIEAKWSDYPRIIKLKWCICAFENQWYSALNWGRLLRRAIPQDATAWIQEAEALNALGRTQESWELLLPAAHVFKEEAAIPYLLACYSGRLGCVDGAKQWLRKAVQINPSIRMVFPLDGEPDLRCVFGGGGQQLLREGWADLRNN